MDKRQKLMDTLLIHINILIISGSLVFILPVYFGWMALVIFGITSLSAAFTLGRISKN